MNSRLHAIAAAGMLPVAAQFLTAAVRAAGAIAVASTGHVAHDGIAFGYAVNIATKEAAGEKALTVCRARHGKLDLEAYCRIVGTFEHECYAFALDQKDGTPGVGWALGPDLATAKERALDACCATAGPSRIKFCMVSTAQCDEHD